MRDDVEEEQFLDLSLLMAMLTNLLSKDFIDFGFTGEIIRSFHRTLTDPALNISPCCSLSWLMMFIVGLLLVWPTSWTPAIGGLIVCECLCLCVHRHVAILLGA